MALHTWVICPKPDANRLIICGAGSTGDNVATRRIHKVGLSSTDRLHNGEGMSTNKYNCVSPASQGKLITVAHCKWNACPEAPMNDISTTEFGFKTNVFSFVPKSELKKKNHEWQWY